MNPDDTNSAGSPADASAARPALSRDTTFVKPDDPSPYIRTYAKDVAMLTNTPAPAVSPVIQAAAPKKEQPTEGVSLPEVDISPVNYAEPASPKEFKQETVALSKEDSDGIFEKSIPVPVPSAPIAPPPPPPVPATPTEDREAILARLRAKTQPAPAFEPPAETPVPPIVPLTSYRPESVPAPVTSIPPTPVAPIPAAPSPRPEAEPSPLHTFTTDFADRVDSERATTFSVLAAQSDSGSRAPVTVTQKRRNIVIPLLGGAFIILIGIGVAAAAYSYTHKAPSAPIVAGVPSLLTFDESKEVQGTGTALMQAIADVANGASVPGNIIVTYLTQNGVPQPGGAILAALNMHAPDILLRNIDPASTVGVVNADGQTYPFFALKVNSYERTFAGMLAWEPTIAQDLQAFYPVYSVAAPVSASSSTSTQTVQASIPPYFSDAVVANHDVRVLRDAQGNTVLLYGYHNKDMLIIARNEGAFTLLISRLTASAQ